MSNESALTAFLGAADAWICDGYAVDVRYVAEQVGQERRIWSTFIGLNPLRAEADLNFHTEASDLWIGQIQRYPEKKKSLLELLAKAATGSIALPSGVLTLPPEQPFHFYSEMSHRDRWFANLHLRVVGSPRPPPAGLDLAGIDNALRASSPPFDGLSDACVWLGLDAPGTTTNTPAIDIRDVSPEAGQF